MASQACTAAPGRLALAGSSGVKRLSVSCRATAVPKRDQSQLHRRSALLLAAAPLLFTATSYAKDAEAAKKAKEERLAQLKSAAQDMKETGKAEAAFSDSGYAVSDDKSPNIHTRQEEGLRKGK
ncbi:hypothetical protein WJX73_002016 [Symbiochloris irregularis]|uniref:Uncharacterized protein n=1 Tax=Symbiochloris irregularis TaxID=706552 RepID=A0AAW1NTZ0_9CHLO